MRLVNAEEFECFPLPNGSSEEFSNGAQYVLEKLDALPAVMAVPIRYAYWEKVTEVETVFDKNGTLREFREKPKVRCSGCKATNKTYEPPYCPHCGARMIEKGLMK